ncbi:MAG: HAMP domain-containing protein [Myxococcales bacterium]|nr:HAMP domain-containing protein [Myxococcales bacterium]
MPRIPLPVKLLLSYLGVLLLGAGPTFFYIRVVLQGDLLRESALRMSSQIQKVAESLRSVPDDERLQVLRKFGEISTHRLTYMSLAGDVLLENSVVLPLTINHASRSEVRMAMAEPASKPEGLPVWTGLHGTGYARRHSETTGFETLYVARQMVDAKNQPYGVLRLATSVDSIEAVTSGTMRFLLNAMAVAASVAILFSLVSAILFVRPLQRVGAMAQNLASGDLGVKVLQPTNDEVGDVARVLNQMATELRRRLLSAGMGEALLSQLVEALPCACVIFEENGQLVACNGAGRRALHLSGPEAGARMNEFAEHPQVQGILKVAENDGQAEPIKLDLTDGEPLQGLLHVLKRPGMAPLRVFVADSTPVVEQSLLPAMEDIVARPLSDVLSQAESEARSALLENGHSLEVTWEGLASLSPQLSVTDAEGRLVSAISAILSAIVESTPSVGDGLAVGVAIEATRIRLHIDCGLHSHTLELIRPLIEPLGGEVETTALETKLWLPRA